MAKAKSSAGGSAGGESKKAKAPAAKKSAAKAPAAGGMPVFDTNLAAQSAARMLMARKKGLVSAEPTAPAAGSSAFKQLKESLAKPHISGMDDMLNTTAPSESRKSSTPFAQQDNQRGHNQTFGADVARSGVPRRTAG